MSLGIYLQELSDEFTITDSWGKNTMGASMCFYDDAEHAAVLRGVTVAFIGVEEVRGAEVA